MSYNMNSKSIWNTAMWFQSACLLFLLASANTPGEIQNVQLESLFKLCGVFLNINWKLKFKAMWPLHNLKPKSFPRLFCELNGQVSKTRTWHLNEVQGSWSEKEIEQKKGKLKLSKRAGLPTTKAGRQCTEAIKSFPGLWRSSGSWHVGTSLIREPRIPSVKALFGLPDMTWSVSGMLPFLRIPWNFVDQPNADLLQKCFWHGS